MPEDLPVFATIPHKRVYFDRRHQPVMACSVQRRTDLLPPKLVHSEEVLALPFISFLPGTTHISTSHLTLLGQLNLQFNGSAAVNMDIFEQTFTCQAHLNGESILHNTTFYRDRKLLMYIYSSSQLCMHCVVTWCAILYDWYLCQCSVVSGGMVVCV